MDSWLLAIAIKPFILLAVFAGIVIPLEILLRPHLPALFTDRTFMSREPARWTLIWFGLMVPLWYFIGLLLSRSG